MTPAPGKTIAGKYRLVKPLATGGMGAVWVAHHEALDTEVAVKLMAVTLAENPLAKARFEREAKALARLKSPHVVQVHDFGVEDDTPYMVMELLQGEDLGSLLERERRLSPARASAILAQACKGIRVAHEAGIVHRDIKPSNLFLATMGGDEVVKILDFGIARATEAPSGHDKTASGILIGTPHFMSPEQARGAEAGPATDLWSLAVVLYVALTGKLPFSGDSMGEILAAILRDEPPRISVAAPGLPPSFDGFFERALAREPAKRFESPTTLAETFASLAGAENALSASGSDLRRKSGPSAALADAPTVDAGLTPNPKSGDAPTVEAPTVPPLGRAAAMAPPLAAGQTPPLDSGQTPSLDSARSGISPSLGGEKTPPPPAPQPPSRSWIGTVVVGVLALAALVLAARGIAPKDGESPSGSGAASSSASSAPPRPTALTDLPPPVSDKPLALARYSEALQAMRGAAWDRAGERLREAIAEDPAFAAAHLRLGMTLTQNGRPEARRCFERASDGRGRLSERDRALLLAWEPLLREPLDQAASTRMFQSASERYPLDAELMLLAALGDDDKDRAIAGLRRAVELDPSYADAWQALGDVLHIRNRTEEAARALDRCLAVAPTSVDCLISRARIRQALGRCSDMVDDLRDALTRNPRLSSAYVQLADQLMFQNVAPEAVLDVQRRRWAGLPEGDRPQGELVDRLRISEYSGQFDALLADAERLDALHAGGLDLMTRSLSTRARIVAMNELRQPRDAALAAEALAKLLEGVPPSDQWMMVPMLRVMARGGLLSKEAYRRRRDALLEGHRSPLPSDPWASWVAVHATQIETRDEAKEAMDARPKDTPPPQAAGDADATVGRVFALAGQIPEALVLFRRAQQSCNSAFMFPPHQLAYGDALSATGDKEGACRAYANVLWRWGNAKPRSITAEAARSKMASLGCPK